MLKNSHNTILSHTVSLFNSYDSASAGTSEVLTVMVPEEWSQVPTENFGYRKACLPYFITTSQVVMVAVDKLVLLVQELFNRTLKGIQDYLYGLSIGRGKSLPGMILPCIFPSAS